MILRGGPREANAARRCGLGGQGGAGHDEVEAPHVPRSLPARFVSRFTRNDE